MSLRIFENLDPLSSVREDINQNFNELFNRVHVLESVAGSNPLDPVEVVIDSTNSSVNVLPEASYYFTIDDSLPTFDLSIGGVSGITFTNFFDSTNFANCKLEISIADPNTIACEDTEVYTTQSVTFSTLANNEAFTFYYFTTGSVIAGMSKKTKPLPPPKLESPLCPAKVYNANKAFWTQELSGVVASFTQQDVTIPPGLQGYSVISTLPGRLKMGYVNTSVSPLPLTIEAVKRNGKYYWTYGFLNSTGLSRVWSLPYSSLKNLGCPSKAKWQGQTNEQKAWINSLQLTEVSFANNCNTAFVMVSSSDGNINVESSPYAKDFNFQFWNGSQYVTQDFPIGDVAASYGVKSGQIDFPLWCQYVPASGFRWVAQTDGGGPWKPDRITMTSQFFPNIVCPTSIEYGGSCIYTPLNGGWQYDPNRKMTVKAGRVGWQNADSFYRLETDINKTTEAEYRYGSCIGKQTAYGDFIHVAYCAKPRAGSTTNVVNNPEYFTNYDSNGPFHVKVFKGDLTNDTPDSTWTRVGNTIVVPITTNGVISTDTVHLALGGGTSCLAVCTPRKVYVYELKGTVWKLRGTPIEPTFWDPQHVLLSVDVSADGNKIFLSKLDLNGVGIGYEAYYWNSAISDWDQLGQTISWGFGGSPFFYIQEKIKGNGGVDLDSKTYKKHMAINNEGTLWVFAADNDTYLTYTFNTGTGQWVHQPQAFLTGDTNPFEQGMFIHMEYGKVVAIPSLSGVQCYEFDTIGNDWTTKGRLLSSADHYFTDAAVTGRGLFVMETKPGSNSMVIKYDWNPTNNDWSLTPQTVSPTLLNQSKVLNNGRDDFVSAHYRYHSGSNIIRSGIEYYNYTPV